jgi:hypothetical protein
VQYPPPLACPQIDPAVQLLRRVPPLLSKSVYN